MTEQRSVFVNETIEFHNDKPFVLIAGPCAIESEETVMTAAAELTRITKKLGIPFVFKSSFIKANRTSIKSDVGIGIEEGLRILQKVKDTFNVPVITDIHEDVSIYSRVAEVVDMLQMPAFLCRQTGLTEAAANTGKPVNVKKGQFLAPDTMGVIMDNYDYLNAPALQCERGVSFGYNNLIVDFAGFREMKSSGHPLILDATHAAQRPGGNGTSSGGKRDVVIDLAKAGIAIGVAGLFLEVHPNPDEAISDKENQVPLDRAEEMLTVLKQLDDLVKSQPAINL